MRNVIDLGFSVTPNVFCRAIAETALEPSPGNVFGIQEIADIFSRHLDGLARGAFVESRLGIADERTGGNVKSQDHGGQILRGGASRVAGNQIDGSGRGRTKGGGERIVAHGKVLGIVPESGDGVAVEISHHVCLRAGQSPIGSRTITDGLHEQVHVAAIESALLVSVVMVLVASSGMRTVQAERIYLVRVVIEQSGCEKPIHRGCTASRNESRLARRIGGERVGPKVVIKRYVFLEYDDEVFDGCRRAMFFFFLRANSQAGAK